MADLFRPVDSSACLRLGLIVLMLIMVTTDYVLKRHEEGGRGMNKLRSLAVFADAHIVMTRDDRGQSLVLTGEDGKGGKGGGGDQLVISGDMGGNQNTNMVLQDAANREGDVVIQGGSMVVPGEDGHIVLVDGRSNNGGGRPPPMNYLAQWLPYMSGGGFGYGRMFMPFAGGQFG